MRELVPLLGRAARATVRPQHRLAPGASRVALTFDDGPDPATTPQVLDLLASAGVPATFFLVGERAARSPALVARIADEGHSVGSHSWSHPKPWELSPARLREDYRRGHDAVQQALGRRTRLFRPPHGHLGPGGLLAVLSLRLRPILWSRDPEDWRDTATAPQIVARLQALTDGEVVLLHDALVPVELPEAGATVDGAALDRAATIAALPALLDGLARAGLVPVAWPVGRR